MEENGPAYLVIPAKEAVKKSPVAYSLVTPWAFSPRTSSVGKAGAYGAPRADASQTGKVSPPLRNSGAAARWAPPFAGKTTHFLLISTLTRRAFARVTRTVRWCGSAYFHWGLDFNFV